LTDINKTSALAQMYDIFQFKYVSNTCIKVTVKNEVAITELYCQCGYYSTE